MVHWSQQAEELQFFFFDSFSTRMDVAAVAGTLIVVRCATTIRAFFACFFRIHSRRRIFFLNNRDGCIGSYRDLYHKSGHGVTIAAVDIERTIRKAKIDGDTWVHVGFVVDIEVDEKVVDDVFVEKTKS
eukprot:m.138690 g.138690  ORF g.138690 m.138690 type:complete len:129 (-) comp16269_c0_seq1:642-1028(-)